MKATRQAGPARRERRGPARHWVTRLSGALGVVILAGLGSGFATPVAHSTVAPPRSAPDSLRGTRASAPTAAPGNTRATVLVDQINPLAPRRDSVLEVSGRLRLATAAPVQGLPVQELSVQLALGSRLGSRHQLQRARTHDPDLTAVGPASPVGADRRFTIRLPMSALPLGGPGVYAMQVIATGTEDGERSELGRTTTFLPWVPDPLPPRVPIGWAWPVLDQPRHVPADQALATEIVPDGRLDALLAAPTAIPQAKVTPVVDPGLLDELDRLVEAGAASPALAAVGTNAQRQLARLRALSAQVAPIVLPYGNVDVSALVANGRAADVTAAIRQLGLPRAAASLGTKPDSSLGMPPDGCVSPEGLAKLASEGVSAVVLSESCLPVDPALTYTPTARARTLMAGRPLDALVSDPTLSVMAALGPTIAATARLAEQDFLAETAMIALEQPAVERSMVIAPPANWGPPVAWLRTLLADSALVPWIKPMSLEEILATPEAARGHPTETVPQLSGVYLSDVDAVRVRLQGACSMMLVATECLSEPLLLQAESAAWRFSPDDATRFLAGLSQVATDTEQGVRVAASPVVTLTSRSGRVPVTLENNLQHDVTVRLQLEALDRSHIRSATSLVRTLRPGQKVQVEVQVQAQSAGRFPVDLQLFTPAGTPVGAPVRIVVRSTVYGTVAVAITVGAVAVLFLAVLVRGIRKIRARRRASASPRAGLTDNLAGQLRTPPVQEQAGAEPSLERERM